MTLSSAPLVSGLERFHCTVCVCVCVTCLENVVLQSQEIAMVTDVPVDHNHLRQGELQRSEFKSLLGGREFERGE